MTTSTPTDQHHRCPPEIISHAVWLFCRLSLSNHEVEALLCKRRIMVTYEAIRVRHEAH
jgi:putative transposase